MILEEATYEAFGYFSNTLKQQSHKEICTVCTQCGKFRVTAKYGYRYFCKSCSALLGENQKGGHRTEKTKALISMNHADVKGKNNPMFSKHSWNFGKAVGKETKAKLSVAMKGKYLGEKNPMFGLTGKDCPNFGTHPTEETKALMSAAHKGEKNYNYKGGKKASKARSRSKRDRQLGYTLLAPLVEGEVGHHVTNEYVIGVPEEVHQRLCGGTRKQHRTKVLQCLKMHNKKKYKLVLCILAKQPFEGG